MGNIAVFTAWSCKISRGKVYKMGAKYTSDDSAAASSKWEDFSGNRIKFLCSYGGKILPRPSDGQLRYVGGQTRLVTVGRSITFPDFKKKLEDVFETMSMIIKYQLPTLDLDILISVTCDEDLQNMFAEYDRYDIHKESSTHSRVRAFLFPQKPLPPSVENQVSPGQRYVDAVNGVAPIIVKPKFSPPALLKVPDYISDPESSAPTEIEHQSPGSPWMDDLPLISCPPSVSDQNMKKVPSDGAFINSPSKMGIHIQRVHSSPNLIRPYQTHIVPVPTYSVFPNRQVLMANNFHGRPATIPRGGSPPERSVELGVTHAYAATKVKSVLYSSDRTGRPLKYMT